MVIKFLFIIILLKPLKNIFKKIAAGNGKMNVFHFSTDQTRDTFYTTSPKLT